MSFSRRWLASLEPEIDIQTDVGESNRRQVRNRGDSGCEARAGELGGVGEEKEKRNKIMLAYVETLDGGGSDRDVGLRSDTLALTQPIVCAFDET